MSIVFVGAGPGATDLITLRGYRHLQTADCVVYAGSLVNPELLTYCKQGCAIYDSAAMNMEEIIQVMVSSDRLGQEVVRLHTGDFSLFGSLREQMESLIAEGCTFQLVPGVSSFLGAASAVRAEYTVPEISQSLIITRIAGRTPVPSKESLQAFAAHQTSMVIFLSADRIEDVTEALISGGYPCDTPCAMVYKATWPDEKIIRGNLTTIADQAHQEGITKTALIMVGQFLGEAYNFSKLYDKDFKHGYRD